MSRLFRWLTPLVVLAFIALPTARAQAPAQAADGGSSSYAFSYFVGILLMIIVMVIVCMPSRKRPRVSKDDD